ncbi:MAG: hypothetical protein PHD51_04175 [Patescibacteria group bacterium]|nr:hypothetical protein [Patescibacteria group bacterium]MDD5490821.1 hypothetical protein [Patescibacteria group bacterium]
MLKKIIVCSFIFLFFNWPGASAAEPPVDIYFFYGDGCPHCASEKEFLNFAIQNKYKDKIRVHEFEVWYNIKNANLLVDLAKAYKVRSAGVPMTFIGEEAFSGFGKGYTDVKIERTIQNCLDSGQCLDPMYKIAPPEQSKPPAEEKEQKEELKLDYPLIRNINLFSLSLPVLTIALGALDGFNPCAMWVLLFLISLLLGMEDKKRMWLIGIAFIAASAATYFLFLAAWLNLFIFMGYIQLVRIAIGLLAIIAGIINLKDYFSYQEGVCKVTKGESRRKIFERIREIIKSKYLLFSLAGIIVLAFAVNMVELVCSIGLPAIYTQILSLNHLPTWEYYFYLLLYIFFFMLDDIIVFVVAMLTLKIAGLTGKYTKYSNLVGGIIILIIGILLILKPSLLMFG